MKMNSNWLVPAALAALALGSCTTKNQYSDLEILKLVGPTSSEPLDAAGAEASCSYNPDSTEFSFQVFNVSRDFVMGIVISNNLVSNANAALGQLNTNDFIVTQVVTTYETTDGSVIDIPQQIEPAQGVIPVATVGVTSAVLIPAAVAAKLAGVTSVRLHTHVEGRLLDGSSVSTNEYMPIAVPTASDTDTSTCVTAGG